MEEREASPPQMSHPRRRSQASKWITLIFGLAFVLTIILSWIVTNQDKATSHSSTHVPPNLGEMELVSQVVGDRALAEIGKLHGKGIEMVDGYIAEYGHGRSRVTVWVGEAASEIAASGLLKQMVHRISLGNQAFRNLKSISVGGREIYTVEGSGGEHFFYLIDNKVIWLAVQGGDSIGVVKKALRTF